MELNVTSMHLELMQKDMEIASDIMNIFIEICTDLSNIFDKSLAIIVNDEFEKSIKEWARKINDNGEISYSDLFDEVKKNYDYYISIEISDAIYLR